MKKGRRGKRSVREACWRKNQEYEMKIAPDDAAAAGVWWERRNGEKLG